MKTCRKCGVDCFERPLHRVNPKGEIPSVWECLPCSGKSPDDKRVKVAENIFKVLNAERT
jgi:hypothetical protein